MTDETLARLRAHDSNISRYRRLLKTNLSDLERRFLERRLSEERSAVESLGSSRSHPTDWHSQPFLTRVHAAGTGSYDEATPPSNETLQDVATEDFAEDAAMDAEF